MLQDMFKGIVAHGKGGVFFYPVPFFILCQRLGSFPAPGLCRRAAGVIPPTNQTLAMRVAESKVDFYGGGRVGDEDWACRHTR